MPDFYHNYRNLPIANRVECGVDLVSSISQQIQQDGDDGYVTTPGLFTTVELNELEQDT